MLFLPLLTIPVLYFTVAMIKPHLSLNWNLCAICTAVGLTWMILYLLFLFGVNISLTTIGVLMGMSLTGLMYKLEPIYKKQQIKNFWFVRLVLVIGGFYSIVLLLEKEWGLFTFVAILSFMSIIVATFLVQGTTHEDVLSEHKEDKPNIIKKLDDCC